MIGTTSPACLIIDDDPAVLVLLEHQLARLGLQARTAGSAEEALAALSAGPWSSVIVDLRMPGVEPFALVAAARAHRATHDFSIVAMSGDTSPDTRRTALARGADAFLAKPILLDALRAVLRGGPAGSLASDESALASGSVGNPARGPDPVVDLTVLESLIGPNREQQMRFLRIFMESMQDAVPQLLDAHRRGATAEVAALAHRLQSSTRAAGARELAEACRAVERAATHADSAGLDALMPAVARAWDRARAYVEAL